MNREAAQESPKYDPKADDWETIVKEENSGCCARCGQTLQKAANSPRLYDLGDRRITA